MPGRGKPLITRNGIPDPQAYNPQTGQWESFIGVSWGKTAGGLYVPIRVDDQGRQEVILSGNIVDLLPRAVRTVSTGYANIAKPRWAKGFILSVMVYGLTGQFTGETDGISLEIGLRGHNSASTELALASTAKYKNMVVLGAIVYPGAIINDDKWIRSGQRIVAGIPSGSNVYYRLNISGIFNAGQGIDCDAKIEWLP